jgi:hypothetical protein
MMVNEGEFDLFGEPAPAQTGEGYSRDRTGLQPRRERHMRYRMPVRAADGQRFFLSGYKVIRDDRGFDVWADTTTLMVTVHAGDDAKATVIGRGILRIYAEDLKKQVKTMEVTGTRSARQRLRAPAGLRPGVRGTLFDAYLGEQHLLPSLGVRRGPLWVAVAAAAKGLAIVILAGLFLWPWRPALLRQEPAIAADPATRPRAGRTNRTVRWGGTAGGGGGAGAVPAVPARAGPASGAAGRAPRLPGRLAGGQHRHRPRGAGRPAGAAARHPEADGWTLCAGAT